MVGGNNPKIFISFIGKIIIGSDASRDNTYGQNRVLEELEKLSIRTMQYIQSFL